MVPCPTIIATWPSHTARSPGRNEAASTAFGAAAVLPSGSRTANPSPNAAASGCGASRGENAARPPRPPELDIPSIPDSGLNGAPPPKPEPIDGIDGPVKPAGVVAAGEDCAGAAVRVAA